ncbi:MAG TPA: SGNH/GDSL hydrolase family protein [Polyangia bacterium]
MPTASTSAAPASAPPRRASARAKALGLLLGLVLSLGLAEILARVVTRPDPATAYALERGRTHRSIRGRFYLHDPLLGWRNRPGAAGRIEAPDYACTVALDADGRRITAARPRQPSRRLIVAGDSVAFGYGVEADESFAARLQAAHPDVEVVNLAVVGYGTDQELLALRRELARPAPARPTTVLLAFYVNDLHDNLAVNRWGYRKPRFDVAADGALTLTGTPVPPPQGSPRVNVLDDRLATHWRTYALVRPRVTNLFVRLGWMSAAEGVDDYLGYFVRGRAAEREPAWRVWEAIATQLLREVRAAGADLVVLVVPTRVQVSAAARARLARLYGYRDADLALEEPEERVTGWGARQGVKVVRALAPLRQAAAAGPSPYFPFDLHPNARGHHLIAATLEEALALGAGARR